MPVVKLDATSSTNDFLKELSANQTLENFTVVTAESQTNGRGQMGTTWQSEPGKNLIMSILIRNTIFSIDDIYRLNVGISLAVIESLKIYDVAQTSIKWPNDILSGNKKIAGILIENLIRSNGDIISVAGIGMNVNQKGFQSLPNASSLANVIGKNIDRDELLDKVVSNIKTRFDQLSTDGPDTLWAEYNASLFRKGLPTTFENNDGKKFMAIINKVLNNGRLELILEDSSTATFGLKQIKMHY